MKIWRMFLKNAILIFAVSRSPWIGGIYYKKNITHMILSNPRLADKYKVIVMTNKKYGEVFRIFQNAAAIEFCGDSPSIAQIAAQALKICIKNRVKYIYPVKPYRFLKILGITPVSWIADFQHCHYPEFFGDKEIKKRNKDFKRIARAGTPLILSSEDAFKDFKKYYSEKRKNVFVVHFTSYLEDDLACLTSDEELRILNRYGLKKGMYIAVCNQFWKHKNHIVVLKAIKLIKEKFGELQNPVVFTGELSDRRNSGYIKEIKDMFLDTEISGSVKLLGFIDRASQLCIIKNAQFIIQPSLFEGWGTVVEDGKALGKRIVLSDIPVHLEQKDENCILFHAHDPENLADIIVNLSKEIGSSNCNLNRTRNQTEEYSKVLEDVFL